MHYVGVIWEVYFLVSRIMTTSNFGGPKPGRMRCRSVTNLYNISHATFSAHAPALVPQHPACLWARYCAVRAMQVANSGADYWHARFPVPRLQTTCSLALKNTAFYLRCYDLQLAPAGFWRKVYHKAGKRFSTSSSSSSSSRSRVRRRWRNFRVESRAEG